MTLLRMSLAAATLLALAGCVVAPAPGYYGGPAYYSAPAYGPYYGPGPNYQYQRYGGTAPSELCGQGYYQNCY